jgi:hypothetical protein
MISVLKMVPKFGDMFQHDQARSLTLPTSTTELFEEFNVNFLEWPLQGTDLSPIELYFGEIK